MGERNNLYREGVLTYSRVFYFALVVSQFLVDKLFYFSSDSVFSNIYCCQILLVGLRRS